ncbi:discoidin domain-containing protein [Endozoicomonas sp. G2_1]|uniref:galactose-binding domain-containing protein n=1 Tax=Endozoicomonas sp. G2_1 TaxID=2821091 RepID=UPI001ADA7496|nr:discoidin domain-containing protein [Endozoicomonas sp. G2_1]MBO9489740.1 discoidin domain-containing protein [Endozoicomonas sp. G2_1]
MNKNHNKITCTLLSNLYKTTGIVALTAFNAAAIDIYVSPTGNDFFADGSSSAPFKTLHRAQMQARNVSKPLTENVNIILKDGTYYLPSTLNLTSADSGTDSFKVTYRAENPGQATISGGSLITGWSDSNNDGIWEATVPAGTDSRQLFVNDSRAVRARSVDGAGWTESGNGYVTSSGAGNWNNIQDIELVFEFRWKQNRGGVSSINNAGFAALDSEFTSASGLEPFGRRSQTNGPSWVENNLALLDVEGEWYLDKNTNTLYYKPRANESLTGANAVPVIIPRLETLIAGDGVEHIRFEGLTFSHATWLFPNTSTGYVSVQAGVTMRDINYVSIEDAFEGVEATPGHVTFDNAKHVVFSGNTFKRLGGAALEFGPGTQDSTMYNNVFEDISSSAIVIGSAQQHHPVGEPTKDNLVDNNLVRNVAVEYRDNPAIISLWADGSVITNNDIQNVPYSGVSVGWGWGRYDPDDFAFTSDNSGKAFNKPTILQNTLVMDNDINGLMLVLHDGGGIYNLSANPNARVSGNVVTGAADLNGAVYLDDGSRGFQVNNNVSYNNRGPRRNEHIKGGQYHVVQGNDWSGTNASFNPAFQSVVDAAGRKASPVERTIATIRAGLPAALPLPSGSVPLEDGLVIGKTATASVNSAGANNAIDGNTQTAWEAGAGVTSGSLTIDLGANFNLGHVAMAFGRIVNGEPQYIRNNIEFEIQSSTDNVTYTTQTFSAGGAAPIPSTQRFTTRQAINDALIANNPEARYVRINVTNSNGQDFGILRAKVKAENVPDPLPGVNLALAGTASQPTTDFGGVASRANDGNTNGSFASGSVTHTTPGDQRYWDVDLGAVRQINAIRLWNRTDCCSDRLADFYVFVSDVPFTSTTVAGSQAQSGVFQFNHPQVADSFEDVQVNRTGRYVRVQLGASDRVLSLAEVEVYGVGPTTPPTDPGTNLARLSGASATQISTLFGGVASRAIDGNTDGGFGNGSVIHTGDHPEPYWTLDLGAVKQIDTLKLFNRTDACCNAALDQFHIFISDTAFTGTSVAASQAQANVMTINSTGTAGASEDYQVNRTGRYIRVQKNSSSSTRSLVFAELQVFGSNISTTPTNLALAGTASQSSTTTHPSLTFPASKAIDGNTSGNAADNSLSHTHLQSQGYWEVDLGEVKSIDNVRIWNRTDCCSNRLTNFHVLVSDTPFAGTSLADAQGTAGVFDHQNAGTAGTTTNVAVNRSGRYVRVQLANTAVDGENVLVLAEVQVFGQ